LKTLNQFISTAIALLILGYIVFGDNVSKLFFARHASQLYEADFRLLREGFGKNRDATVATLEDSFVACMPRSVDSGIAKYHAEIYAYMITQNIEFMAQLELPDVGSIQRAEIETKFKSNRNNLITKSSDAKIAAMSSSQQTKLKEFDEAYTTTSLAAEWSNCAMTGALQKLASAGS
jgi:hypothetical protein